MIETCKKCGCFVFDKDCEKCVNCGETRIALIDAEPNTSLKEGERCYCTNYFVGHKPKPDCKLSAPVNKEKELEAKVAEMTIDFATWYSGMGREKVEKAYQRYLSEQQGFTIKKA